MLDKQLLLGMLAYFLAQLCVWFQSNSQFVWEWWENKPFVAASIFAFPISICFWHGAKFIYDSTGELWTARFIGFGMSYLTFPILTHVLVGESMFTAKTMVCTGLAFAIMFIQMYWR